MTDVPFWIYEGPETPLTETSLFTGAPGDPPLARELAAEMACAC